MRAQFETFLKPNEYVNISGWLKYRHVKWLVLAYLFIYLFIFLPNLLEAFFIYKVVKSI